MNVLAELPEGPFKDAWRAVVRSGIVARASCDGIEAKPCAEQDAAALIVANLKAEIARRDAALAAAPTIEPFEAGTEDNGDRVVHAQVFDNAAAIGPLLFRRCRVLPA